jgi:superfamily II DNA or RNA helicase
MARLLPKDRRPVSALAEWTDETSPSAHLTEVPRPVDRFELPAATLAAAAAAARVDAGVLHEAVRLALSGGPDEELPGWQEDGLCRSGGDVDSYFPALGSGREFRSLLDRCAGCPVQSACLASALSAGDRWGIWGGTSENGRRKLRKVLRKAGVMGVTGEDAFLAWMAPGADREPAHRDELLLVGITPRPHQREAVAAVCAEIASGGPCQIAMATASGKTHVGLWVAEHLDARRVLVLVPNLALVAQTAELWQAVTSRSIETLAVCSDTGELTIETTTEVGVVRDFLQHADRAVVFATYQSSAVVAAAGVPFDLTIADEAHHLAGETGKAFASVLRGEIPTARTLFMTATPRRFHRHNGDVDLVGMDDEAFGPRVYELNLSDAVAAGIVADYRVIVAAVDRDTFDRVAAHPELGDVDPHLLAGAIAVVRAMGDSDLRSCISFHTRVERARTFASLVGLVAEQLPGATPAGPGWSGFLNGDASMRIRRRLLARLVDDVTWGVIANAKTLGEGVDVPALDSIAIVDPKTSEQDVMQAVGRALRRPGAKAKVGTVLLPVLLTGDADPDDPLAGVDDRSVDIIAGVLRALRAHDADLGSRLDRARRRIGVPSSARTSTPRLLRSLLRGRAARGLLRSRVQLWLPGGATGDLAGALSLRLIRESTASWEESYSRLCAWVEQHGSLPAQGVKVPDETGTFALGAWMGKQRTLCKRGMLASDRIARLEALAGWTWNARDEHWWRKFELLTEYVERHGWPPARAGAGMWRGSSMANFVRGCRAGYTVDGKEGGWLRQFPDRIAALEAMPGWVWNELDAAWEEHFDQLRRWATVTGHADPAFADEIDGFRIGAWTIKQRAKIRRGQLDEERAARLRALPGWRDEIREAGYVVTWDENVEIVARWMAEHDGQQPPQTLALDSGFRIGHWCAKQRNARRSGALSAAREARLSAIPGWQWQVRVERWDAFYDALVEHVQAGGSAGSIPRELRPGGINLGNWATTQRLMYERGTLTRRRIERLEAVPGWRWLRGTAS